MIIGGAGGLGQLIAKAYAEAGAKVAIASRNEEKLKAACEELKAATGKEFKYYVCDATVEADVEACAKKSNEDFGHIDILVNSQGINKKYPLVDFPLDEFELTLKATYPHM
jgi:gluconate 5-dehydrogenase